MKETVSVGKGLDHLAVSPNGDFIYFTAAYVNEVWALNAKTLQRSAKITVDQGPHGIAVSADGVQVYVANRGEGASLFSLLATLKKFFQRNLVSVRGMWR